MSYLGIDPTTSGFAVLFFSWSNLLKISLSLWAAYSTIPKIIAIIAGKCLMTPAGQAAFLIYAGFVWANLLCQLLSTGSIPVSSISGLLQQITQFLDNLNNENNQSNNTDNKSMLFTVTTGN